MKTKMRMRCRGRNGLFWADDIYVCTVEDETDHYNLVSPGSAPYSTLVEIASKKANKTAPIVLHATTRNMLDTLRKLTKEIENNVLSHTGIREQLTVLYKQRDRMQAILFVRRLTGWCLADCKEYVTKGMRTYQIEHGLCPNCGESIVL